MSARFEAIVGQAPLKGHFDRLIDRWAAGRGGLHHAYLLAGQEGLGKRAFAEELAALIVARGRHDDAYERALRGAHPDVGIVEREGDVIRYEQVARLVSELSLKPFLASERVWIVDEADKLQQAAANKLLKSLEEPPAHVFFILVTSAEESLLPTILSRCELVRFSPVARADVLAMLLDRQGLPPAVAGVVADLAGGSPGRAVELADDALGEDRRGTLLDATLRAVGGERVAAEVAALVTTFERRATAVVEERAAAEAAAVEASIRDDRDRAWHLERLRNKARRDISRRSRRVAMWCVDVVASALRDVWVASIDRTAVLLNGDRRPAIEAAAVGSPSTYARALAEVGRTRRDMLLNVDRELALLALFTRIEEVCAP